MSYGDGELLWVAFLQHYEEASDFLHLLLIYFNPIKSHFRKRVENLVYEC